MSSKTEKPTRKRLREATKKGQSFKSRDLVAACLTLCGVAYLLSFVSLADLADVFLLAIASDFQLGLRDYSLAVLLELKILLPVILLCFVASALPSLLQTGFAVASEAVKFNPAALSPAKGIKKIFSLRSIKEIAKTVLYVAAIFGAILVFWRHNARLLFESLNGTPKEIGIVWTKLLLSMTITCLACMLLVLVLDAIAEYFLFMKDMKMDRSEVKRDQKDEEGNPQIKGFRREAYVELLSEQTKSDIAQSRLIIANPTHVAVGIYHKPEITPIPFISLLETNLRALAVRAYAEKVGVPVVVDVSLARRIHRTHRRYSFVKLEELEEVLRLLAWLEQVEEAGLTQPESELPEPGSSDPK